jgi:hypothetical protein
MSEANVAMQKQSAADELKSLADKFLASQGVAVNSEEKKADVMGPGMNILIGIPTHSGEIKYKTVLSLLSLVQKLRDLGIRHEVQIVPACPLIQVVRNYFANKAAFDLDREGLFRFTHLLQIDSDGANFENGVMRLIVEDKPISGLLYSTKTIAWSRVEHAVRSGVHTDHLPEMAGIPDLNAGGPFAVNVLSPVRHIGTGTLLVQSRVFRDLAAAHPEWKYKVRTSYFFGKPNPDREWQYDFFQTSIDPDTKDYVPEDFFFTDASKKIGYDSFVLASERTYHTGEFDYIMNLPLIASHPMAQFS